MPLIKSGPASDPGPSPLGRITHAATPDVVKLHKPGRILSHPARTVTVGFLLATPVGAGLLMLPIASAEPGGTR